MFHMSHKLFAHLLTSLTSLLTHLFNVGCSGDGHYIVHGTEDAKETTGSFQWHSIWKVSF